MKTKKTLLALAVLTQQLLSAQNIQKITGPLGVYHISAGETYADTSGNDSTNMQYQFRFGELCMPNQSVDNNFDFVPELDSCNSWHPNKVLGIIQPPGEHGVYNQPADTVLYAPFPQLSGPGMIQGGQRFSRLSQLYGGYCGVILDDWNRDTSITHKVHDAVQGRYVDAEGNVYSDSVATTPYNKLYCVVYSTEAELSALPYIDGLSYWIYPQSCCFTQFDSDIAQLRANYPNKEILVGTYVRNGPIGWANPAGFQYVIKTALNSYDEGYINGITVFAGVYLVKDTMPLAKWDSFALPSLLDSFYFPYLGEGQGALYDCTDFVPLSDAFVHVFCKGRLTGDTLSRSHQKTDAFGQFNFGLWAGNRNTDSTYYWLVAEKPGYITNSIGFWIKRNDTTAIPNLALCPLPVIPPNALNMLVYPNPAAGQFTVVVPGEEVGSQLEIFNLLGAKVYSTTASAYTNIDLSNEANGVYILLIKTGSRMISQKVVLLR